MIFLSVLPDAASGPLMLPGTTERRALLLQYHPLICNALRAPPSRLIYVWVSCHVSELDLPIYFICSHPLNTVIVAGISKRVVVPQTALHPSNCHPTITQLPNYPKASALEDLPDARCMAPVLSRPSLHCLPLFFSGDHKYTWLISTVAYPIPFSPISSPATLPNSVPKSQIAPFPPVISAFHGLHPTCWLHTHT
jgi:hypothetical protein